MLSVIPGYLEEASDYEFYATLVGETGLAIDPSLVTALTGTLRDVLTGIVLWANRNVLNANGGALITAQIRNFTLRLTPADTMSLSRSRYQRRELTLSVTHSAGRQHNQVFAFTVEDLTDIAAPVH